MVQKQSIEDYHLSRKYFERHTVSIRAQYFIKGHSTGYQECTIINMSRSGLALTISEEAQKDNIIFLEIIAPKGARQVNIRGQVIRFDKQKMICGVKYDKAINKVTMDMLLGY